MNNRSKNIIYSLLLLFAVFAVWLYRKNQAPEPLRIEGKTMGTTYHVTYFDEQRRDFKNQVDSLLLVVNQSINNYDSSSEISQFNRSGSSFKFELPYFYPPLKKSLEVFSASKGAFDPTVMPLVNAWGFGAGKVMSMDSARVDSLKAFVGFEKIALTRDSLVKLNPQTQIDFGGIGQGYGSDVITDFLKTKGISNALVELGGEGIALGVNLQSGNPWEIGILDPNSDYANQFFKATVKLQDMAFTTSGNYFNFREVDGKKYSHTIDPQTGFPVQRQLLSASVFAADAITADAWATALMVMGHENAIELLKDHPELEAFLIYTGKEGKQETYVTAGITTRLTINP
jgi:thiamine biosynthesis lipoprotein